MNVVTVAALMTVFNRRETTWRCLDQLRSQDLPGGVRLEVYMVDDGSTDGTSSMVQSEHPDVHLLEGTGSLFWTGGMHLADRTAWLSEPDYLLWLNDDVDLDPDAVAVLLQSARQTSDRAIVVGAVTDPASGEVSYGGHRRVGRPLDLEIVAPSGSIQSVDTMNGNVVLVPSAVRSVVGPPDLAFSHNMADMDYAFRARWAGFGVVLAPRSIGRCEPNRRKHRWRDPSVPLRERFELVRSVKGMPVREWWVFTRRHTGRWWPRYLVSPYLRAVGAPLLDRRSRQTRRKEQADE